MLRPSSFAGLSTFAVSASETLHDVCTQFRMTHLSAAETDGNLDLVSVVEETDRMISFRLEVVGINVERQTDLFDFNYALVLFRFFFTLCLFETVFTVIDDFAYGRRGLRGNLYEVKIFLSRKV